MLARQEQYSLPGDRLGDQAQNIPTMSMTPLSSSIPSSSSTLSSSSILSSSSSSSILSASAFLLVDVCLPDRRVAVGPCEAGEGVGELSFGEERESPSEMHFKPMRS